MAPPDPFLTGNFAPVPDEATIVGLAIDGELPAALDGWFARVGPNPAGNPERPYRWSGADPMVHAVELRAGRALAYRNRWITTPRLATVLGLEPPGGDPPTSGGGSGRVIEIDGLLLVPAAVDGAYELTVALSTASYRPRLDPDGLLLVDACLADTGADHFHHPLDTANDGGRLVTHRTRPGAGLVRVTFDLVTRRTRTDVVDPAPQGLGRINETYLGRPARFGYTVGLDGALPFAGTTIHKHDLVTARRVTHDFGRGRHPGEFVFAPDPDRGGEDGGWLLGLVHGDRSDTTELVVLDAEHLAHDPVARVLIPRRVPFGLHATWLPRR